MDEINLVCCKEFENVVDDISVELKEKYQYEINKVFERKNDDLDNSYGLDDKVFHHYIKDCNTFIYSNFIPNIDTNIMGFNILSDYFNLNIQNNLTYGIIPYMNYGFNLMYRHFFDFEKEKYLSKLLIDSEIDYFITVNNEYLPIHKQFEDLIDERIYNIDIIPDLFENIENHKDKDEICFRNVDYKLNNRCTDFNDLYILNIYKNNLGLNIKKENQYVIFLPIIRDYEILKKVLEYLKGLMVELVTLGILPEKRIYELLKSDCLVKIVTSDIIPLSEDLQSLNKLILVSSLDKIVKKIHELDWI